MIIILKIVANYNLLNEDLQNLLIFILSLFYLITVWNDGAAADFDPGIPTTLVIPGFADWNATGIDVLNGFEQALITRGKNGDLVINNFFLKDYPIIIRLSK